MPKRLQPQQSSVQIVWLRFIFLVILLLTIAPTTPAKANASNSDQETGLAPAAKGYLLDPTGQLTLEDVRERAFQPFTQALSFGYKTDTVWLKLSIDPLDFRHNSAAPISVEQLVLRLTNPLLDTVKLYDPLMRDGKPLVTGDRYPNSQTELDLSSLTFLLPVGDEPRDVYVSVQSTSSLVFSVMLGSVEQALKDNRSYDLFGGVYLGLLVVFLVLAVALGVGHNDRVTRLFIVQQALAIVWSLSLMGYTRQYLGPWLGLTSVDFLVNFVVVSYTLAVSQFATVFLGQFKWRKNIRWLIYSPVVVFTPLMIATALGYSRLGLSLNAIAIIAFSFVGMLITLFVIDWKVPQSRVLPRWLVTVFFVTFGFATPLATSVTLRVEPVFQNAFVGFFFTTALAGVLMSTLLLTRSRNMAREVIATTLALDLQQQRSQEQARFLGMLAHEFKTPLSIIKMVVGSGQLDTRSVNYSEDAIRNIDALLEKCLQAESLLDTPTVAQPVIVNIEELVRDVVASSGQSEAFEVTSSGISDVRSDPTLVRIVLANLIDNALKYRDVNAPIKISLLQSDDTRLMVRVSNKVGAAGIPEPARVFEKYYRTAGAMSQSGSGLGLYLSRHIARMLGGELQFEAQGSSVQFDLLLPRNH